MSPEGPGEPVSVIVADDQTAVREGLVLLLGTLPGIVVAGQAADGSAAVDLVAAVHPQVVLMDLNMPGCDGVCATRRITADHPGTRVVVLTTYADDESIISALQAGRLATSPRTRPERRSAVRCSPPRPARPSLIPVCSSGCCRPPPARKTPPARLASLLTMGNSPRAKPRYFG